VPVAQAPVCDGFTPACAALHALSYVVPLHPHTSDTVVGQLVGFAVQTPSSLDEHSPVSFLQYWLLVHVFPRLPPHAGPVAQAPVCDTLTPAFAALHALSYVVPSHPHTRETVVGQVVGIDVQTPSSLSEQSPVSFLQYWLLAHVFPKLPPHSSPVEVQAPVYDTLAPACAARHELSYVVPSHPHTRDTVVGHEDGIGLQRPSSSAEQEPVSRLQYSLESHVSPALPPHTVSVDVGHAPRVSP
jgi:hypothetical protein